MPSPGVGEGSVTTTVGDGGNAVNVGVAVAVARHPNNSTKRIVIEISEGENFKRRMFCFHRQERILLTHQRNIRSFNSMRAAG